MEVKILGPRFVIGSAADCSMCCKSTSVSPHHCEIYIDQRQASVRSLCEETGTFVNGQRVEGDRLLHDGDHLRIGRLEFQVLVETPVALPSDSLEEGSESDKTGEELSDMLVQADEKDREFRLAHPEVRELHLDSAEYKDYAEEARKRKERAEAEEKAKKGKKRPGGLPPPPVHETEDSTEAAQEALRRLFRP